MDSGRWKSCEDPRKLLAWVRGTASNRKLRLFACACWRWWWLAGPKDRFSPSPEALALLAYAEEWAERGERPAMSFPVGFGWHPLVARDAFDAANWTARQITGSRSRLDPLRHNARDGDARHLADLLRDIVRDPFMPAAFDQGWLTPEVVGIAKAVYEGREFDALPVLADALEDAGCTQPALLGHCRGLGPHVLGCWALDLVLRRE